ncbi:helicase-exonuclease AddAB subunit AddA [Cytobacillus sp. IB215316]|uniref:helicase-exonuclease AddAB subunit AddA n=1 Tax=Cytobacillus sp. IB215316 TaxID=3097354 RepID=UPI002A10F794|nr:helicase-exonuclease AddAB subunit AddA [Cytobacillus sp. IB215316]MDX8361329.1 helicase-exonuclease AddAB subunit AddA [Cytobacillus sp. IB215316]
MTNNLPPKPTESQWTDEQWQAIVAKGQSTLVAAAAGSGKTAVLVERIIKKITSIEDPIDVDRLLVVTFTNASAAEMRSRIGEAIEQAIKEDPSSLHLRKQLSLLNRASISTLHSFCLEVIRKYYYLIDIDPSFRIADEVEGELIREEVIEDMFEEYYGMENNDQFFQLVDCYSNDRNDADVQVLIKKMYDFSRSHPSPNDWLNSVIKMYEITENTSIEDLPYYNYLLADINIQLEGARGLLEQALTITKQPSGPAPRATNIEDDLEQLNRIDRAKNRSWNELYEEMQGLSFSRAKVCRGDQFDDILIEKVTKLRKKARDIIEKLHDELFRRKQELLLNDIREMEPTVKTLVTLVKEFAIRFESVKQGKGLVDFADLEHYCLQILRKTNSAVEEFIPSEAALDYREQFQEVLVDEYQDTNMVQESIIQFVTTNQEHVGNLFMVGDVKQSIYRFRLAEPLLFLSKYKRFSTVGKESGLRIDLAKNFRSRSEVLNATNYIFKQLMNESVGEIDYNSDAELKLGALDYPSNDKMDTEFTLIEKDQDDVEGPTHLSTKEEGVHSFDPVELETAQLEARFMASKIKELINEPFEVFDRKKKMNRRVAYRDIVILLRSMTWAPQIMEEFKQQGIPIYANLSTGYFEATEVAIMLSLLKVIDNPLQDIPLASVLRSPIVQLNGEELANIRLKKKKGTYYEALTSFLKGAPDEYEKELHEKISNFYESLQTWRMKARNGSLSDLIWKIYRETQYYDYVGGLPGGKQRQANLRALYDRARQYEATSFRGLFRFLRFIDRMQDRGDDLGTARAIGEQEDVVRLMTIHSSKGLEFPIVFVSGLSRQFNRQDLNKSYLLDKNLGFASKYINPSLRISYPTLPQLTLKMKMKMELIAEEMRVLYVALTRAKEKLFLVGTVKQASKVINEWQGQLLNHQWLLSDYDRVYAKSYLDWLGPTLIRHRHNEALRNDENIDKLPEELTDYPAKFRIEIKQSTDFLEQDLNNPIEDEQILSAIRNGQSIDLGSSYQDQMVNRLTWEYPNVDATKYRSKQAVSEIKRMRESLDEFSHTSLLAQKQLPIAERPLFLQEKSISSAERGTAMHLFMQQIKLHEPITIEGLSDQLAKMVVHEIITEEQSTAISIEHIHDFFQTELGERLVNATMVKRELPFSLALPAKEAYPKWQIQDEEAVLVQGMIDCVFEDDQGVVLLDYKTDTITGRFANGFEEAEPILTKRYRTQIDLYRHALEQIWQRKIDECYLFFFDGSHLIRM